MIQRIQSLYLLLAAVFMGLMAYLPIAEFYGAAGLTENEWVLRAFNIDISTTTSGEIATATNSPWAVYALGIVVVVSAALAFVNIFLYKKRMLQFRLCASEVVLLLGAQIFAAYFTYRTYRTMEAMPGMENADYFIKLPFFFPVIAIILTLLALRGIMKDIALVKSLDRIR